MSNACSDPHSLGKPEAVVNSGLEPVTTDPSGHHAEPSGWEPHS